MHLIDKITRAWNEHKPARFTLIAADPDPQYSNLDRMDGLR